MAIKRRVFISSPRDPRLDRRRNELKWAIVKEIEKLGYEAQVFGSNDGGRGLATKTWSPDEADRVMRRCVGAAILGFPIWTFQAADETVSLVSEYCHYEGALARAYRLPILGVLEAGVKERVFFLPYGGDPSIQVPAQADHTWVSGPDFGAFIGSWDRQAREAAGHLSGVFLWFPRDCPKRQEVPRGDVAGFRSGLVHRLRACWEHSGRYSRSGVAL